MASKRNPKYMKLQVQLPTEKLTLYAGSKVISAVEEITTEMTLYKGVRLSQVLQAVYVQGQKDGRREIIDRMEGIKKGTNYLPPGRPRKKK